MFSSSVSRKDHSVAKKTTKKRGTKKSTKKKTAARASGPGLGKASIEDLQAELARREREVGRLQKKRERLAAQIAEVESELAALGALGATGGVRKRPKNEKNLTDTLHDVLSGKTMGVTEAANAARAAGYLSTAENFRTIVNQTLLRETKKFKKVARGQYTAK